MVPSYGGVRLVIVTVGERLYEFIPLSLGFIDVVTKARGDCSVVLFGQPVGLRLVGVCCLASNTEYMGHGLPEFGDKLGAIIRKYCV